MKTDKLFYEFFQIVPQAFFDLLRIEPACDYTFESPVVKSVERRMDGLFLPAVATEPCYFLEVQAQLDATIYWRMLQQITLYFVQRPFLYPPAWHAVILFLDRDADPGLATLGIGVQYPSWLRVVYLPELFAQSEFDSPIIDVLRPLVNDKATILQSATRWGQSIHATSLDTAQKNRLENILSQLLVQKLTSLSYKEIEQMLQLTPLEETWAGVELMAKGKTNLLRLLIHEKFGIDDAEISADLSRLSSRELDSVAKAILTAVSYDQIEWLIDAILSNRPQSES